MPIAFVVALHDLRRRLRDRTAIMTAFVAPFMLASIMGLAFGDDDNPPQIRVAVADAEGSPVSRARVDRALHSLSLGPGIRVVRVDSADEAHRLYAENRVAAAITTPPLRLESSDDRPFADAIGNTVVAGLRLQSDTERMLTDVGVANLVRTAPASRVADNDVIAEGNPLSYFGPSMAIVFLFMLVGVTANGLLAERAGGTMARMQVAPIGIGTVIAGKTASIMALMLLSVLSLWGATTLVFGAHWGAPLAVLILAVAAVGAIGALGLFVTVAARTESTAQVAAAALGFVLALLGGNFFPPGSLPPLLETLSLATPNGWALEGFTTLSLDRGTLNDVLQPVVILMAITAVVGTAAIVKLRTAVSAS